MDGVPISGVSAVRVLQSTTHDIHFSRDRDEMNVVRHQTVADQCQAVQLNALSQQVEINLAISIGIKNGLWTLRAPTKSVLAKLRNDDAHWRMNFSCGSR